MTDKSLVQQLLELKELEAYEKLNKKEPPKKKWWNVDPVRAYIILVLLYPVIGPAYKNLILYLWR